MNNMLQYFYSGGFKNNDLFVTGHFSVWPSKVGQIDCILSMEESLTICNNVTISDKWPANYFELR